METKVIEIISTSIQRQFPEFAGTKPKVRLQGDPKPQERKLQPTF
jgi:hypothetical protein